jgi:hypothetical protein
MEPPVPPAETAPGDVVLVQDGGETFYAVVLGERLGRLRLRPCAADRPERHASRRRVLQVFKPAGRPDEQPAQLRPDPQLRFRL